MATLHGIHHADRRELEYSNLSSGLTLWDVLHRTYLSGIAQERLTIGLPAYARDADLALRRVLTPAVRTPMRRFRRVRLVALSTVGGTRANNPQESRPLLTG